MRSLSALLLLVALEGWSAGLPEDEYALPHFALDAGTPSAPAPQALPTPPLLEAVGPAASPSSPVAQPAPAEPRWSRLTVSVAGTIAGRKEFTAGVEVFLGVVFGAPRVVAGAGPKREVAGLVVQPGFLGGWSRVSGPVCAGSDFCGQRWTGGASVRVGHATGHAGADGVVSLRRLFFGEAGAQVGGVVVPPAPLTVGSRWVEGVFQLRGGVQLSTASTQRGASSALLVHLCALVEYLAFNPVGQGVQVGLALGVGF